MRLRRVGAGSAALAIACAIVTLGPVRDTSELARPAAISRPTLTPNPIRDLAVARRSAAALDPGATAARVAAALAAPALGRRVSAFVVDAATGAVLLERGADRAVTPASTSKLVTAAAALLALGPDARLTTYITSAADGSVTLVGGGDPTLSDGDLTAMARGIRTTRTSVRSVSIDGSLFTGPRLGPAWKPTYVTEGAVAPVTALSVDGGRRRAGKNDRVSSPDVVAGERLGKALRRAGVAVPETTIRHRPRDPAAAVLATSHSLRMSALVEQMLTRSDNDLAEALGRHVARAYGLPADFAGEVAGLGRALTPLALGTAADGLQDASGLSTRSRLTPRELVRLLAAVFERDELRPVLSGLPVAAFSGTLSTRYDRSPSVTAAGRVRAKTGSLDGVSTLAGVIETAGGATLLFAFAADQLPGKAVGGAARAFDAAAAALASCGC